MWSLNLKWFCLIVLSVLITSNPSTCNPVATNFNASLRDYSVKEDDVNSTTVKTLQKEEVGSGRYANFAPARNPIKFKDIPDNALSSSSYGRGLLHHEHAGYGFHDYDDSPHHGYGYEYNIHDSNHHDGYSHHHHPGHPSGHHVGYGHHHKHYDHGLATKAILWPIAGIALLGAAAALVSNPVLLQLGVISGRRRRRDTEEITGPDFDVKSLLAWSKKYPDKKVGKETSETPTKIDRNSFLRQMLNKRVVKDAKQRVLSSKAYPAVQSSIETVTLDAPRRQRYNKDLDDDNYVPVPIKIKSN